MTIRVSAPAEDAAPSIAALLERHALESFGEPDLSVEEIRSWFSRPKLSIRVAERDGDVVGYMDLAAEDSGRFPVDLRTLDPEAAELLLREAEQMGRSEGGQALRAWAQGDDPVVRPVLEAAGWHPIRYSFQMRIELGDDLPEPVWPEGLSTRNMRPGEEERVYEANMDAFADHWDFYRTAYEDWLGYNVSDHSFEPSLWWLVDDGDELAAFCLNSWHFSGDPQFGWIGSLGVRPAWRRHGLATALLRHSFRDFRARGATRVGLGVDGENTTGAVRLYERAGMSIVRRYDIVERELRAASPGSAARETVNSRQCLAASTSPSNTGTLPSRRTAAHGIPTRVRAAGRTTATTSWRRTFASAAAKTAGTIFPSAPPSASGS
jgi:mycothiol synthase